MEIPGCDGWLVDDRVPLSLPLGLETEGEGIGGLDDVFGEVVVSAETALREASKRGLTPEREVALYSIHGTLHLVGFDDTDATSCRKMRREERKYLMIYEAALGH